MNNKTVSIVLSVLTVILMTLTIYFYANPPIRTELVPACPVCDGFTLEEVEDTSVAKNYLVATIVSGSSLVVVQLIHRYKKRKKDK